MDNNSYIEISHAETMTPAKTKKLIDEKAESVYQYMEDKLTSESRDINERITSEIDKLTSDEIEYREKVHRQNLIFCIVMTVIFTVIFSITVGTINSIYSLRCDYMELESINESRLIEINQLQDNLNEANQELDDLKAELDEANSKINKLQSKKFENSINSSAKYQALAPEFTNELRIVSARAIPKPEETISLDISNSTTISGMNAEQFDLLINTIAEHRGIENCVFCNTGESFEYVENTYGINGIYLLAIFTNESGFGEYMIRNNNAAGIKIGGEYVNFNSINECILYLGKLLFKYSNEYNLSTFEEIGSRYCEDNDEWVSSNKETCDLYVDFAYKNISTST